MKVLNPSLTSIDIYRHYNCMNSMLKKLDLQAVIKYNNKQCQNYIDIGGG